MASLGVNKVDQDIIFGRTSVALVYYLSIRQLWHVSSNVIPATLRLTFFTVCIAVVMTERVHWRVATALGDMPEPSLAEEWTVVFLLLSSLVFGGLHQDLCRPRPVMEAIYTEVPNERGIVAGLYGKFRDKLL